MPKCLVCVGEKDPLRDEQLTFAKMLKDKGFKVETTFYGKMIHAFCVFYKIVPDFVELVLKDIKNFIHE